MGRGRKKLDSVDWDYKLESLKNKHPEVSGIDWPKIISEHPNVFESIAGGIAKKFDIDRSSGLAGLYEEQFVDEPFVEAFEKLWGDRTVSEMSKKTGISPNVIRRLRLGERPPMFEDMEAIAAAFNLDPGYFAEYRNGVVISAINNFLDTSPETAFVWYGKVRSKKGIKVG